MQPVRTDAITVVRPDDPELVNPFLRIPSRCGARLDSLGRIRTPNHRASLGRLVERPGQVLDAFNPDIVEKELPLTARNAEFCRIVHARLPSLAVHRRGGKDG